MQLKSLDTPLVRRVVVTAGCVFAFMVMASVFTPDRTRAGGDLDLSRIPPRPMDANSAASQSADAHDGLRSLGCLVDRRYAIYIYATELGPRYTVCDTQSGRELGTLLSAEQLKRFFPEIQIDAMELDAPFPLMLVDPIYPDWMP